MRITNASMVGSYMHDLQNNLKKIDKLNEQVSTGLQINKLSDDPYRSVKIMRMENEIKDIEKHNLNINQVTGWVENTDGSLESLGNVTSDMKQLLISAGNGTYSQDEIKAISLELNAKMQQIGEILNTTHGGEYLFSGSNTEKKPVEITENSDGTITLKLNDTANDDKLKVDISDGIKISYNTTAKDIINTENPDRNYFDVLNELSQEISKNPPNIEKITGSLMDEIEGFFQNALDKRTETGAKENILEMVRINNEDHALNMKTTLSLTKDVDIAEKFIELQSANLIYSASVQVGSKLIQPTILDYL